MNCSNCKNGEMKANQTTYYRKVDSKYIIIENVPCYICDYCGEISYSIKTLEAIDKLISKTTATEKANVIEYDIAA